LINWPVNPVEGKYSRWYNQLISQAKLRTLEKGVYVERHHIIPRSFRGSNDNENLVDLTAREHYIAHALLWKMKFPEVYGSKMSFAFNTFINRMRTDKALPNITYKINSRVYQSFKVHYANLLSKQMSGPGNHFYGKTHNEETKRIIGEKSKLKTFKSGAENPNWGKKLNITPEGTARKIAAGKALWADPEWRNRVLEKRKQASHRPEIIAKRRALADARVGVKRDPASIEKTAAAKRGKTWEELYSPEQIARMHAAIKNRVLSPEAKAKMKGRSKGVAKIKYACPHCGTLCAGNMLAKWHGDNCKLKIPPENH
jgi:hypothetical protein